MRPNPSARLARAVAACALPFLAAHCGHAAPTPPDPIALGQAAVVTITTSTADGTAVGQGTGFLIDRSGLAVTDFHVLAGAGSAMAKTVNGRLFQVLWVQRFSAGDDIAIVQLGRAIEGKDELPSGLSGLRIAATPGRVGQHVVVVGSPEGMENSVSEGLVSALRGTARFQFTAPVSHGSSGSPVLDADGRVLGVVDSAITAGENLNFAVSAAALAHLRSQPAAPVSVAQLWRAGAVQMVEHPPATAGTPPQDPAGVAVVFSGSVNNTTGQQKAPAGLVILADGKRLRGCFAVTPPLIGSSALLGRIINDGFQFITRGDSPSIVFAGAYDHGSLSGRYAVNPYTPNPQLGTFSMQFAGTLPLGPGFRDDECPTDADMRVGAP